MVIVRRHGRKSRRGGTRGLIIEDHQSRTNVSEIHTDLSGRPRRVSTLLPQTLLGRETAAFQYHLSWLEDPGVG